MPYQVEEKDFKIGPLTLFTTTRLLHVDHTALLQLIDELKKRTPATVTVLQKREEDDNSGDGPYTDFSFIPQNPRAAAFTITLYDDPFDGPEYSWTIDAWSRLDAQLTLKPSKRKKAWDHLLFDDKSNSREPAFPTLEEELQQIYQAVSQGRVHLTAGIAFNRLWGIKNAYIELPTGKRKLAACGDMWIAKLAALIGKGRECQVHYEAW
jgi:hypothetical protein